MQFLAATKNKMKRNKTTNGIGHKPKMLCHRWIDSVNDMDNDGDNKQFSINVRMSKMMLWKFTINSRSINSIWILIILALKCTVMRCQTCALLLWCQNHTPDVMVNNNANDTFRPVKWLKTSYNGFALCVCVRNYQKLVRIKLAWAAWARQQIVNISIMLHQLVKLDVVCSTLFGARRPSHAHSSSLVAFTFALLHRIWSGNVIQHNIGLMQILLFFFRFWPLFLFSFRHLFVCFSIRFRFSLSAHSVLRYWWNVFLSLFVILMLILLHFNLKFIDQLWIRVHQFYIFKCCIGFGRGIQPTTQTSPVRRANSPDHPNPALAITEVPSPAISRIGWALRVLLLSDSSSCLKDRKVGALSKWERIIYPRE